MKEVDDLIGILKSIESSSFKEIKEEWLAPYPNIPGNLKYLYEKLGYGSIGGRYTIHALIEPDEIYDSETAKCLNGIVIVGDDFAGNCDAYDTKADWQFGSIGHDGVFEPDEEDDFISFLTGWFTDEDKE